MFSFIEIYKEFLLFYVQYTCAIFSEVTHLDLTCAVLNEYMWIGARQLGIHLLTEIILLYYWQGNMHDYLTFPLLPKAILATSSTFFIFPWQYLLLFIIKKAPWVEAIKTASKISDVMMKPPCWNANGNDKIPPPTMVDTSVNIDENTVPVLSCSSLWTRLIRGLDSFRTGLSSLSPSDRISKKSLQEKKLRFHTFKDQLQK